ncbi:hypothetical protein LHYA1_G008389 [Lachnellula hyalina]|uniref:2EXR domain-containing protein n=1 Tax=Lachnellula hyalina TaxID=1316788 RepID=A0A8H8TWB6_9HELO|nr:uncharacterized protein LHYA1_G008389 [Lachnellula hyalina]TVY22747.1 hypothetical protein LHYA1_G008389 [Lachnellula hyalina]
MDKNAGSTVSADAMPIETVESSQSEIEMSNDVKLPLRTVARPLSGTSSTISKALRNTFQRSPARFGKFSLLPAELRLKIWKAALEPRVHELHPCSKLYNQRMTFRSNASQTPPIFHACHEARQLALKHYRLMRYDPVGGNGSGKGILRFYFCPKLDTLLLNSLMGLFVMFVLLEEHTSHVGTMQGWETVAFDAERAQLITLLSGIPGHNVQPRIKELFPELKRLVIAFDYKKNGKTRFRTSVWPGENGTSLKSFPWPVIETSQFEEIFKPMRQFLVNDYEGKGDVPEMIVAKVKRKQFIRGDVRYVFRKGCAMLRIHPRGVFRRI